jgi:hypothetical protein
MAEAVSGHELAKTYDCRTPGCTGEARSKTGRHAYCDECRIVHGTAWPDGAPIESKSQAVSKRRKGKPLGPFEERALALVDAARHVDLMVARYKLARPALETAVAAWRAALADAAAADISGGSALVPQSSNGTAEAALPADAD